MRGFAVFDQIFVSGTDENLHISVSGGMSPREGEAILAAVLSSILSEIKRDSHFLPYRVSESDHGG